jgi:hypothetical protein
MERQDKKAKSDKSTRNSISYKLTMRFQQEIGRKPKQPPRWESRRRKRNGRTVDDEFGSQMRSKSYIYNIRGWGRQSYCLESVGKKLLKISLSFPLNTRKSIDVVVSFSPIIISAAHAQPKIHCWGKWGVWLDWLRLLTLDSQSPTPSIEKKIKEEGSVGW